MTSQANTQCPPLVHIPTAVTHTEALVNFTGPSSVYTQQEINITLLLPTMRMCAVWRGQTRLTLGSCISRSWGSGASGASRWCVRLDEKWQLNVNRRLYSTSSPCFTPSCFNDLFSNLRPLLNLPSAIFGLTPFGWLRCVTLTSNFWWEYYFSLRPFCVWCVGVLCGSVCVCVWVCFVCVCVCGYLSGRDYVMECAGGRVEGSPVRRVGCSQVSTVLWLVYCVDGMLCVKMIPSVSFWNPFFINLFLF
jgi:hypothetical protein